MFTVVSETESACNYLFVPPKAAIFDDDPGSRIVIFMSINSINTKIPFDEYLFLTYTIDIIK